LVESSHDWDGKGSAVRAYTPRPMDTRPTDSGVRVFAVYSPVWLFRLNHVRVEIRRTPTRRLCKSLTRETPSNKRGDSDGRRMRMRFCIKSGAADRRVGSIRGIRA